MTFALARRLPGAALALLFMSSSTPASANDLTIHLAGNATLSRKSIQYQCDASGTAIGVPSGPFTVEYINGGGNSLAIVPISGHSLIFSNVMSGSGARYTAQQYTWWDAAGAVTLSSDALSGKTSSTCKVINKH